MIWSDRYEQDRTEVYALQMEIAKAVAAALQTELPAKLRESRPRQADTEAYEALQLGRQYCARLVPEGVDNAGNFFEKAARFDPDWAEPYAAQATLYFTAAANAWRSTPDAIGTARAGASQALERDPSHAMAHAILGAIRAVSDYKWDAAETLVRTALASDALPLEGRALCAEFFLASSGRFDEAVVEITKIIPLDPMNPRWRVRLSWILFCAGQYSESLAQASKALEGGDVVGYLRMRALNLMVRGKRDEPRQAAEELHRLMPSDVFGAGILSGLLANAGEQDQADRVMAAMSGGMTCLGMILHHWIRSATDSSLDWFEKDIDRRSPHAPIMARAAFLDSLRSNPRWPGIAARMNLK